MNPNYTRFGKVAIPITPSEFRKGIRSGHFCQAKHKAYCVLLYYSAVRKMEALRVTPENFTITKTTVYFSVGVRLKKQKSWFKETDPLPLSRKAKHMDLLVKAIQSTKPEKKVFPYSPRTAYNIVSRVYKYPHLFRLSRISWFLERKWSLLRIRSWTALSLVAIEAYAGKVALKEMGESLAKET